MAGPVLVLHTTEGTTLDGAVRTLIERKVESHKVIAPETRATRRLVDYDHPARSLKNLTGSQDLVGETNRRGGVYQVEIVGLVDHTKTASRHHLDNWPAEWWDWTAEQIRLICKETGVPIDFPYDFGTYPKTYGLKSAWRLNAREWAEVTGIIGHQHVPENTHGDPSHIRPLIQRLQPGRLEVVRLPSGITEVDGKGVTPVGDPEVFRAQVALRRRGFYTGKLDGDFGPKSEAAVLAAVAEAVKGVESVAALEDRLREAETRGNDLDQQLADKVRAVADLEGLVVELRATVAELTDELERLGRDIDNDDAEWADWARRFYDLMQEHPGRTP